ncbi:hypothetical protein CEXT_186001 [Caerostris extrusa]|uniref:Uncharacterized protein n=1 Tax=Caerostris extrusa TaxID=172846 RepID=A0AAV4MHM1_CAEEX|nr:hypothetical protein CEXT_186001 [Caerostris extrusa]
MCLTAASTCVKFQFFFERTTTTLSAQILGRIATEMSTKQLARVRPNTTRDVSDDLNRVAKVARRLNSKVDTIISRLMYLIQAILAEKQNCTSNSTCSLTRKSIEFNLTLIIYKS